MHPLISHAIFQGVPAETIYLLLALPIVVTLVAFFRQVIGIKAFGIYTPSLITFSFLLIERQSETTLGALKYGVPLYGIVVIIGMISRWALKHLRLLHTPRVAITLTLIDLAVLALLYFGASFDRTGFAAVSLIALIIMIVLVEKFVAMQSEKDTKTAVVVAVQTLIVSLIAFFIVNLSGVRDFVLHLPWIVLFALPINFFLGKWSGLRISEYYRFHSIIGK